MKPLSDKLLLLAIVLNIILFFSTLIHSEPPNLTLVKNVIKNYHDSGLYQKELTEVITKARHYIIKQALSNPKEQQPKKLAIILDIDETSLSNYDKMVQRDFAVTHIKFHKDIMAANAPAIKPTLALYRDAIAHGIKVFFISGRNKSEEDATQKNLIKVGYKQWTGLYLRPNQYRCKSIVPFKSHAREMISHEGYTIIASIGDQYSDLKGGHAKEVFKLPNPFYYLP